MPEENPHEAKTVVPNAHTSGELKCTDANDYVQVLYTSIPTVYAGQAEEDTLLAHRTGLYERKRCINCDALTNMVTNGGGMRVWQGPHSPLGL